MRLCIIVLNITQNLWITLPKKCPYSELFWSVFSGIPTEYGEVRSTLRTQFVRMQENEDQNNSEHGHFSHSVKC